MTSDIGTRLDWLGAVWLSILALSWLIRWRSKIPGRFISVSGWLIIINGLLLLRWPRIFGANTPLEIEYSTRFIVYCVSTWLHLEDWAIYRGLTVGEKAKILDAMLLLKKKPKVKRVKVDADSYVNREDHEAVVAQLAALKQREEGKKENE